MTDADLDERVQWLRGVDARLEELTRQIEELEPSVKRHQELTAERDLLSSNCTGLTELRVARVDVAFELLRRALEKP